MALFSATARTAAAAAYTPSAASAAYAHLRPASANRIFLRRISVTNTTATDVPVALIRTTAMGTATTSNLGQAWDGVSTGLANLDSAWSTNPTAGAATAILDRVYLAAAKGGGYVWVFGPNELACFNTLSVALISPVGAGQILDVTWVWDE